MTEFIDISFHRKKAFQYLTEMHNKYGHFPIFEFYPEFKPKKDKGWFYTFSSPFLHANVMYSLLNAGYSNSDNIIKKATGFLYNYREPTDLWRFWKNGDSDYPVECGTEDTAISSIVLEKLGFKLRNKKILNSCINKNGSISTWILADYRMLLTNPASYFWLKRHRKFSKKTIAAGMFENDDAESTITATVVSYLKENSKTERVISYLVDCWNNDNDDQYQFYDKKVILAFHIARAYKEGCMSLIKLSSSVQKFILNKIDSFSFPELLISYLTINYFVSNESINLSNMLKEKIIETLNKREAYTDSYQYISSKDRMYFGGGGCLTASWFLEVTKDW